MKQITLDLVKSGIADEMVCMFEEKYPMENRPRKALEAAKKFIKDAGNNEQCASSVVYTADVNAYNVI